MHSWSPSLLARSLQTPETRLSILLFLAALAARGGVLAASGYTAEDFYITLRHAENLAAGHGLVYQPGERVLGATSPLYACLLGLGITLGLSGEAVARTAGLVADSLSCVLAYRLGESWGSKVAGATGAILLLFSPPSLTWAVSGMETPVATAAGLALLLALARERPVSAGILAGALILLRPDGLLLAGIALGALALRKPLAALRAAALASLVILPWVVYAWAYYGSPFPATLRAKAVVYGFLRPEPFPNLPVLADAFTRTLSHKAVLTLALIGALVAIRRHREALPALLWAALVYGGLAWTRVFLFGWYLVPPSPVYLLMAGFGLSYLLGLTVAKIVGGTRRNVSRPECFALAILFVLGAIRLPEVATELAAIQMSEDRLRKAIGLDLRERIPAGERLMLEPIGYIGYFSRARILDAAGLVSPEVLRFYRNGSPSPYLEMMRALRPEWALLRAGEVRDARNVRAGPQLRLEAMYAEVHRYAAPSAPPDAEPAFVLFRRLDSALRR